MLTSKKLTTYLTYKNTFHARDYINSIGEVAAICFNERS